MRLLTAAVTVSLLFSASVAAMASADPVIIDKDSMIDRERFDALVPTLITQYKAAGVGIGVIREGDLVWTAYYGEQAPGVPVTDRTVFNTASVAKTVTAETMIVLSSKGLIDLHEPIAPYLQHPDLSKDERYKKLTARLLLSHRAGLLNWAYEYPNNRLAFDHEPGQRYSYSGAGVQLAAEYAEAKLGTDFEKLTSEHLLIPSGIEEISMGYRRPWMKNRLAKPMDEEGRYRRATKLNPGLRNKEWQASDDLLLTVKAYSQLLVALIEKVEVSDVQQKRRTEIITSLENDPVYSCPDLPWLVCPDAYGHSIGWQVFTYGDHRVLKHSGSDAGENAFVYYSPDARHGAVIFVNGANGWVIMTRIIEFIGDEPLIADYYRALLETVLGQPIPALER